MHDSSTRQADAIELTADIVAAYASSHRLSANQLPGLIATVHGALTALGSAEIAVAGPLEPAVPVKKSVTPDYIVCLEDGRKFKSLKRHLRARYGLTPEAYRAKWSLPFDYPMVAPNYAKARSDLAREIGLGQQHRKPAA
jgi:predicted transcriptional regulator